MGNTIGNTSSEKVTSLSILSEGKTRDEDLSLLDNKIESIVRNVFKGIKTEAEIQTIIANLPCTPIGDLKALVETGALVSHLLGHLNIPTGKGQFDAKMKFLESMFSQVKKSGLDDSTKATLLDKLLENIPYTDLQLGSTDQMRVSYFDCAVVNYSSKLLQPRDIVDLQVQLQGSSSPKEKLELCQSYFNKISDSNASVEDKKFYAGELGRILAGIKSESQELDKLSTQVQNFQPSSPSPIRNLGDRTLSFTPTKADSNSSSPTLMQRMSSSISLLSRSSSSSSLSGSSVTTSPSPSTPTSSIFSKSMQGIKSFFKPTTADAIKNMKPTTADAIKNMKPTISRDLPDYGGGKTVHDDILFCGQAKGDVPLIFDTKTNKHFKMLKGEELPLNEFEVTVEISGAFREDVLDRNLSNLIYNGEAIGDGEQLIGKLLNVNKSPSEITELTRLLHQNPLAPVLIRSLTLDQERNTNASPMTIILNQNIEIIDDGKILTVVYSMILREHDRIPDSETKGTVVGYRATSLVIKFDKEISQVDGVIDEYFVDHGRISAENKVEVSFDRTTPKREIDTNCAGQIMDNILHDEKYRNAYLNPPKA
jgi:hypothetical protein